MSFSIKTYSPLPACASFAFLFLMKNTAPAIIAYGLPSTSFAYKYVPPVFGNSDESCAEEEAFAIANVEAKSSPRIAPYELIFAVGAILLKSPAPIIELKPK